MLKGFNFLFLLLFVISGATAQQGVIRAKNFTGNGIENHFTGVTKVPEGYLAVGITNYNSNGPVGVFFVTCDTAFNEISRKYAGAPIASLTSDGGMITAATARDEIHNWTDDYYISKIGPNGVAQWRKFIGGFSSDIPSSVTQLPNGNFLVIGLTSSTDGDVVGKTTSDPDIWLIELNSNGQIVRQKIIGGTSDEISTGFYVLNSGLLLYSQTYSSNGIASGNHGSTDILMAKLDENWNIVWSRMIGGSADESIGGITVAPNGEILLSGASNSTDGDINGGNNILDGFLIKMNASGSTLWTRNLIGTWYDEFRGVTILDNGNIAVTGNVYSGEVVDLGTPMNHFGADAILFVYTPFGEVIWTRRIGSTSFEDGFGITQAVNGNIIVAGLSFYTSDNGDFTGVPPSVPLGESMGFLMELKNSMNIIKGKVYYDNNANNSKDPGENFYLSAVGSVKTRKREFFIDQQLLAGTFFISADSGSYTTSLDRASMQDIDTSLYGFTPKIKATNFNSDNGKDSFDLRIVPIGLVKDLTIKLERQSEAYINNSIKYLIRVNSLGDASIDTALVSVKLDNNIVFQSSTPAPLLVSGDRIYWKYSNLGPRFKDSITLFCRDNSPSLSTLGQQFQLTSQVEPIASDLDSIDNKTFTTGIIKGQNEAVSGFNMTFTVSDSARINRPLVYPIVYSFNHQLDSLTGTITLVKDKLSLFESSLPAPLSVLGDTITWRFKDLANAAGDTIKVVLRTKDSSAIPVGTTITQRVKIVLDTKDTTVLLRERSISQAIKGYFVQPDLTTTGLTPPNDVKWTRSFGGTLNEEIASVLALKDSGYIVAGWTSSVDGDFTSVSGPEDAFVTRFDKQGSVKWTKTFGGNLKDRFNKLIETEDGNFVACGTTEIPYVLNGIRGGFEAWIVKFNGNGDTIWTRRYGSQGTEKFSDVRELKDKGFVFAGEASEGGADVVGYVYINDTYNNSWLVKTDSLGRINWQKCFADSGSYIGQAVELTKDNSIYFAGRNYSPTVSLGYAGGLGFLTKLDTSGTPIWKKEFRFKHVASDIRSMASTDDGNLIIAGNRGAVYNDTLFFGTHGSADVWIAKIDSGGNFVWEKFFGGIRGDLGNSITKTSTGNFIITGSSYSTDGNITVHNGPEFKSDGWIIELDASGKLLWQRIIGGSEADDLNSAVRLADGDIITVGNTRSSRSGDINFLNGAVDGLIVRIGVANIISGKVYVDKNSNGNKETNEPMFSNAIIRMGNPGFIRATDVVDGLYSINTDNGKYNVSLSTSDTGYYFIFPALDTVEFNKAPEKREVDFRLVRKRAINDLRIEVLPLSIPRPGFNSSYLIKYENKGTTDLTGIKIKFVKDLRTILLSTSVPYTEVIGDTIVWEIPALNILESGTIGVELKLQPPPILNFGESIFFTGLLTPLEGDSTPVNNFVQIDQFVRGSYDPNDKNELHNGKITPQMIEGNEYLTYVIRFQNTGNDTAFNVYVRDTLDKKLDWSSIEMITASHPYNLNILAEDKLEWEFKDILLPDSNINEPASHGFISFRIKLKPGAQLGDTVKNNASIYFDFNPPVITNTVETSIVNDLSTTCPGGSIMIVSKFQGLTYRWQRDTGAGFADLVDNGNYSGSSNDTLNIIGASSGWYGYKYRCKVTTNNGIVYSPTYKLKLQTVWKGTIDKNWENPGNWNCGVVPDANTDVVIDGQLVNYPEVNASITIRSVLIRSGASVTIKPGVIVHLSGK